MGNQDNESFDPKSWLTSSDDSVSAAPGHSGPPRATGMRRMAGALSGSLAIILCGMTAAWLGREPPQPLHPVHDLPTEPASVADEAGDSATISRRIVNLASPQGLAAALRANGLDQESAGRAANAALAVLAGRQEEIRVALALAKEGGRLKLVRLEASFPDSSGVTVNAAPDGRYLARSVAASLNTRIFAVRGEMNDADFYSSAVAAGVTDSLISTFAQAFVYDFNFQTEISQGDIFEAAFEQQVNSRGEPVGPPRLLYASMVTAAKSKALYRFQPPGEEEAWFDGNGRSVKRSFMRTPVDGARITSRFGMRFHPVLHYNRLHGGTDFAAPIGTPIYATASGTVTTASPSSCAGNMVIVRHDNGWETRYFHLDRYAVDMRVGQHVPQGFEIGVVGTTGTCTTGPHLHYEVHIDGQKVDPESIPTEQGAVLAGEALKAFFAERDRIDVARVRSGA